MKMQQISNFSFKCRILRVFNNGFTGLVDQYLIKFQDTKYRFLFHANDEVLITIERADEARQESIRPGYIVIYCILKNYLPNGIQFVDSNREKQGFFWNYRGFITHNIFESFDVWEKDALLRIMIKRLH